MPGDAAALALSLAVDLVVVGPEGPLVAGVADAVRASGITCFGPSAEAARLEGSKAFAHEVMAAAAVPTSRSAVATTADEVARALDEFGPPYVVKDDGLAAGKGVVVTDDRDEALRHAIACGRVVIEEFLDGPEVSLFALSDGTTVVPLAPAQDFKRVGDGDSGPNTGGMGAYSPLPWAPADLADEVLKTVLAPTIEEMAQARHPVRRVALRRPRADLSRCAGHRVQRPVRGPGDPGRAGPAAHAARRTAAGRRHGRARPGRSARLGARRSGDRRGGGPGLSRIPAAGGRRGGSRRGSRRNPASSYSMPAPLWTRRATW